MKKVFIISTCEKIQKDYASFHFKGFYLGQKINLIRVTGGEFIIGRSYVLALTDIKIVDDILFGKFLKAKELFS